MKFLLSIAEVLSSFRARLSGLAETEQSADRQGERDSDKLREK